MPRQQPDHEWFTVAESASRETLAAIYRGALTALRPRIVEFELEIISNEPWPAECAWAVTQLHTRLEEHRNRPRHLLMRWLPRGKGLTLDLDLRSQDDFDLALTVIPFTLGGMGLGQSHNIIWIGGDIDMHAAFKLSSKDVEAVRAHTAAVGGHVVALVPLDREVDPFS